MTNQFSLLLIKALLLSWLTWAQSYADDQDAIKEIAARLDQPSILQGDFSQQKNLKFLHKPLISSGSFTYHQAKGLIWKTQEPILSLLLINDSRLLTEHEEQALPGGFAKIFKAMLGGDIAALSDSFKLSVANTQNTWQIDLKPKDDLLQKFLTGITLSGDSVLRSIIIHEASGNSSHISFSHLTQPSQITPEQESYFERLSAP